MLFGSGIELGIGIDTHPDKIIGRISMNIYKMTFLTPDPFLLNFEVSPINFYCTAQYQGFAKTLSGPS